MEQDGRVKSDRPGLNVPMLLVLGALGAAAGVGLSFLMRHFGAG